MSVPTTLVWFRHDLRTDDQPALQAAARSGRPLLGLYVWPNESVLTARRRYFIWQSLRDLQARLAECAIPLHVREGNPVQAVAKRRHIAARRKWCAQATGRGRAHYAPRWKSRAAVCTAWPTDCCSRPSNLSVRRISMSRPLPRFR